MSPPLVRFEGVSKRFGGTVAVEDVSLDIQEGEFFALLGPSGCGKTTLMRLLAGFEAPDAGRILLDGRDIAALPPHRRPVHMMFQSYALFPHLSVAQNVAFGLKGLPKAAAAARVEEMLALVRLDGLGARKPHQLSGGQQQRVALARALAPRPRILLLDEPMAALDRKLREETQLELMALQRRLAMTFMIVTHDQDEAMVVADRMAVMQSGRLAQVGPPRELYERPASRAVARFIGEVNLFGDQAVRPESITLHRQPQPDALAGTVTDYAYLGDRTRYLVQTEAALVKATAPGAPTFSSGDQVWLTWPTDAAVRLER
ncbi:ABC transporter ATP-binding protein [Phenylobacterium sp.]|uniref:ABC transporter ATP-binding protein n=1 Tax=Phenylobacterium sp. TaxID=1871053 RepID=UPI002F95F29F